MSDAPKDREIVRLNAALDGELPVMEQADVEADGSLSAAAGRLAAVRQAVGSAAAHERAPDRLVRAIAALAAAPAPARRRFAAAPMALAASLVALGLVAGIGLGRLGTAGTPSADDTLAASYLRASLSGGGIDIASSDRHTVKPWLATRAPLGTAAIDLADAGFALVGGRVDVVAFQPVPTLVYAHGEHRIALTELPLDGVPAEPAFTLARGLNEASWRDNARSYRAVSDIARPELEAFAKAFRAGVAKEAE